jgi:hypothetical protein
VIRENPVSSTTNQIAPFAKTNVVIKYHPNLRRVKLVSLNLGLPTSFNVFANKPAIIRGIVSEAPYLQLTGNEKTVV